MNIRKMCAKKMREKPGIFSDYRERNQAMTQSQYARQELG